MRLKKIKTAGWGIGVLSVSLLGWSACLQFEPLRSQAGAFMNAPGTDITCLDRSAPTLEKLLSGGLQQRAELEDFWGCSQKAVDVFQTRVRGVEPGVYQATELRTLVTRFFIRAAVISDGLLAQVMQLKVAFLGGPAERVESGELEAVRGWIRLFKEETLQLYPVMARFLGRVPLSDADVEESAALVARSAERVGRALSQGGVKLEFETMRGLLDELSRFVDDAAFSQQLVWMRDRVVLLEMIKTDLMGGAGTGISGDEWTEILKRLAQSARWYLKSVQLDQR